MNIKNVDLPELRKHLEDQIYALDQSAIVAITDSKGVINYVNSKFCELSEYSEDQLIGSTHSIINSGYHGRDFFVDMWTTITNGLVWRGEVCNRAKSGNIYWVDTTIVPFVNDDGKIEKYVAIRYDITSRKVAEDSLAIERKKLMESEKMASIGVLSAGIAHELGNPLGAIRGRLEMLQTMCQQEEVNHEFASRSIEKMIENVDRMSKIIRALKSSSRDGSKDQMQTFDLCQLVGDILELSAQKCLKNSIKVDSQGLDQKVLVEGRETEIGQVIVNLFNNAFDAIKGQKNAWIKLELIDQADKITLHVKDSGDGVPEEIRSKIFDPFYTTKEVGQGTGLGLSICRSFVNEHGGSLIYDENQQNSCFSMTLPKTH